MKLYKGLTTLEAAPERAVATIGNFDGVHVGHQEIFRQVKEHAARIQGAAVAITFRPHPHFVLRPDSAPELINTYEEKLELLQGMDIVLEEPFSREFSNTEPDSFVNQWLVRALNVQALYLGYDFAFGKGRSGSVETLKRLTEARGIAMYVVPPFKVEDVPVSSSLIRGKLNEGDIAFVNKALGREFFLRGLVFRGDGRGRTIGVPTANLQCSPRKFPRTGVYATRTLWQGKEFSSITNIGVNPTFKGDASDLPLKIETHIFDFDADLYGHEIEVRFLGFIREEKKFSGVQDLLAQMQSDFAVAKKIQKN